MLNKIILVLSMTLNLVLALIIYGTNKPVKLADFRDALSDTPTTAQQMQNSLANATPAAVPAVDAAPALVAPVEGAQLPVAPGIAAPAQITAPVSAAAPVAAAAPIEPVAPIKTAALMITGGNDWRAYKQDAAEDSDVFISNIFRSRKNGERAVAAAVRRTKARGKNVLFSCLLPEKSGGVFYVIRMAPPVVHPPQVAGWSELKSSQVYSNDLSVITHKAETDIQEMF